MIKEAHVPNIASNSIFLIDSWTGHCINIISDLTPARKHIITMIMSKGTTRKILIRCLRIYVEFEKMLLKDFQILFYY